MGVINAIYMSVNEYKLLCYNLTKNTINKLPNSIKVNMNLLSLVNRIKSRIRARFNPEWDTRILKGLDKHNSSNVRIHPALSKNHWLNQPLIQEKCEEELNKSLLVMGYGYTYKLRLGERNSTISVYNDNDEEVSYTVFLNTDFRVILYRFNGYDDPDYGLTSHLMKELERRYY